MTPQNELQDALRLMDRVKRLEAGVEAFAILMREQALSDLERASAMHGMAKAGKMMNEQLAYLTRRLRALEERADTGLASQSGDRTDVGITKGITEQ